MTEVLLLASGGLDSTTLAYWLNEQGFAVRPLFFDYGQHCVDEEWTTCQKVLCGKTRKPERLCLSDVYRGSKSKMIVESDPWKESFSSNELHLPYRTLLFFSVAAARAQTIGVSEVYSAFINTDHVVEPDSATEYLNNIINLTSEVGRTRFLLPFRNYSKADVARIAVRLNVPIGETFSCQLYSDIPCGACGNCVERIEALREVGIFK